MAIKSLELMSATEQQILHNQMAIMKALLENMPPDSVSEARAWLRTQVERTRGVLGGRTA